MSQAFLAYSFNILAGETINLWIHGYDQQTYVGFDLKPSLIVNGIVNGQPVFTGETSFLKFNVVGVGEHVDTTVGYTLSFTSQSSGADVQELSAFLLNLYQPIEGGL